jgi:hypothetical protein
MRYALALGLLLLPATAFAQQAEAPNAPIPVQKCVPSGGGAACSKVVDGAGLTAGQNWKRVDPPSAQDNSRPAVAAAVRQEPYKRAD